MESKHTNDEKEKRSKECRRLEEKGKILYLDSHLSNKDGSKDVVGNCEKHPFLQ